MKKSSRFKLPKRIHAVTVDGFDEGNLLYIRLYYK